MFIHEYFVKAVQDDARRAGERDRLLREARRARRVRRQRLVPAASARRRTEMGKDRRERERRAATLSYRSADQNGG